MFLTLAFFAFNTTSVFSNFLLIFYLNNEFLAIFAGIMACFDKGRLGLCLEISTTEKF